MIGDAELLLLSGIPTMRQVEIESKSVSDEGIRHIGTMENLSNLKLDCPNVSDVGMEYLSNLPKLRLIEIRIGTAASCSFLKSCPKDTLRFLSLHGKHIQGSCLNDIKEFNHLEDLDLSDTGISDEDVDSICSMHPLINIDVRKTRVTKQGAVKLKTAFPKAYIRWGGEE